MYTMIYYGRSSPGMPVYHLIKPHLGGKITDVGCGSGILLDKIKEDGFDVTGIDIASNCYKGRGRTVNKNLITIKDIRTDKLDKCDTVVCIDVMEHIPTKDVDKTIELIERHWKIDGRIARPNSEAIGHTAFMSFCRKIR